jgi:hypothetical protein
VVDDQKPSDRLALFDLLPQPRGRRLLGLCGNVADSSSPIAIGSSSRSPESAFRIIVT